MSARFSSLVTTLALALCACARPNAIRAEPDAGREGVIEVPLDEGSPGPRPWAAHAKAGEVVVIHASPEQAWGPVIHAMDVLKRFGGKSMVLAAGASRRTKAISFPNARELAIAHLPPEEGEMQAPTTLVVSVAIAADGSLQLNGESRRGVDEVRRSLVGVERDGGLPTIVMLRADRDTSLARVLDVVDVVQERGLPIALSVTIQRPN